MLNSGDRHLKIALIRQKYTPFGGAERYMSRLIAGLVAKGHDVHVFASQWQTSDQQTLTFHQVPAIRAAGWLRSLTFSINCGKLLRREYFDVIFSLERTQHQDIYRAGDGCHRQWLCQKNLGKGILARLRTYINPLHLTYLNLERKLFTDPALKAIIANSKYVKEEIVRLYGVSPEKIHVVYNGIDPDEFANGDRALHREELAREFHLKDEVRLLYVGSGFERKGVPTLLKSVARLQIPYKLFIVGKGRLNKFKKAAKRLGIGEKVIFSGPRTDVHRFYLGSDIFVFPTLYDPFSNATLEAMACGLPVITTPFNGVSEIISEGRNGCVINDPLDDKSIADAITRLAVREVREPMGEEARRTAGEFTMERNVMETIKVISSVRNADASLLGARADS
jgi:UDP-glucose:(heptosyl)LPS alpha-1,3-glucosyltransferase